MTKIAPSQTSLDESVREVQDGEQERIIGEDGIDEELEKKIRLKVDLRLCSIAGILCSLNLLDSGVISSASVTSMLSDLELNVGNRYSVSIFIFTIASIAFQLPSTIAVRTFGPRIWFSFITICFGIITLCTAFVQTWRQMIALRILLGISMSGVYPGVSVTMLLAICGTCANCIFSTANIFAFYVVHEKGATVSLCSYAEW